MYMKPFEDAIYRIFDYFGRDKMPKMSRIRAWFANIEYMDQRSLPWIEKKICDDCDNMPWNIAKTWKTFYNAWKAETQKGIQARPETPCGDCWGKGLLWFFKNENGYNYEYAVPCTSCDNWKGIYPENTDMPKMTVEQLLQNGWQITGPTLELKLIQNGQKKISTGSKDLRLLLDSIEKFNPKIG